MDKNMFIKTYLSYIISGVAIIISIIVLLR